MITSRERAAHGLRAGDAFTVSRTLTAEDVVRFAALSRDYNPVHFDERFARVKNFTAPICHGLLAASLVTEIGGQIGWLASGMNFRFRGPVYPGDTVTCTLTITEIDPKGRARAAVVITNQEGATVIESEIKGIVPGEAEQEVLREMLSEGDPSNPIARRHGEGAAGADDEGPYRILTPCGIRTSEEAMEKDEIRGKVREGYGQVARENRSCCGAGSSCCGSSTSIQSIGAMIGYSQEEMSRVPEGANLGLGCGNPVALAGLKAGQTVLDLGSGAGFDCFLAARAVGAGGRVIGVDMTPEMVAKARENAAKGGYKNVEFRLGEIENLPVPDGSVDVILSNCVINLSPEKPKVFAEAFRVLKPGGVLTLSDVVLLRPLPPMLAASAAAYLGCVAGASLKADYLDMLRAAGFADVKVVGESPFYLGDLNADPIVKAIIAEANLTPERVAEIGPSIVSIKVAATKSSDA